MSATADVETFPGRQGDIAMSVWPNPDTRRIVILAHGYGEQLGRYDHVAGALVGHDHIAGLPARRWTVVRDPDHVGDGLSDGERLVVTDFALVDEDLHTV